MAVPASMKDLSLVAVANSPAGTDAIGTSLDDYLRAHASILRSTNALATTAIPSASTIDVAAADGESVYVSGSVSITSLGTGFIGCYRELRFAVSLTLVHSVNLFLGGANIVTQGGDAFGFRCIDTGIWALVCGSRTNDPTKAPLASPAFTGTATYNGIELGYRGVPQTVANANYTFAATDKGRGRVKTDASAYTYTVPASVFAAGDVVTVLNSGSAGAVTLAQGAGVTLQLAGTATAGARTVGPGGLANIYFDSPTHAFVSGAGVS